MVISDKMNELKLGSRRQGKDEEEETGSRITCSYLTVACFSACASHLGRISMAAAALTCVLALVSLAL